MDKTLKINYRRLSDGDSAPVQLAHTFNEFLWSDVYELKVFDDDGSHGLPFSFADDETLTLVVKDHPVNAGATLQRERKIVQTITYVQRSTGGVYTCTRTRSHNGKDYVWSGWAVTKAAEGINLKWDNASHINTYTTQGTYDITGERTNYNDGLPIENAAPGHTVSGRLFVLDSTINDKEICVTQVLMLSNRMGGDGNAYIRTGSAGSKEDLKSPVSKAWSTWGKLQTNVEVGHVSSLDAYIDNGIFSGIYTADGSFETFVMVVINNYVIAGATGKERRVSQLKYALNINGVFSYSTRLGTGNEKIAWGEWKSLDKDSMLAVETEKTRAMGAESKLQEGINALVAGTVPPGTLDMDRFNDAVKDKINNPLRPLFIAAGAEYNDTDTDITKTAPWGETVTHKAGHYYLNGLGDIAEEQMMAIYNAGKLRAGIGGFYAEQRTIRTNLPHTISGQSGYGGVILSGIFSGCENLEVAELTSQTVHISNGLGVALQGGTIINAFYNCRKLKYIQLLEATSISSFVSAFNGCKELAHVKIKGIKASLGFPDSSLISKESVLFIIRNAAPTLAITITLHSDVYLRLADDAEIVAALEGQPLISLVSA